MAKVFLGLPVYNGATHLGDALESIRQQTFRDWTLLISDNASTDATEDIARRAASEDSRIHYHRQASNIGPWNNFKFLLAQAQGDCFAWFPDDYVMKPRYLEACVTALEADAGIGMAATHIVLVDERGRPVQKHTEAWKVVQHGDRGHRLVVSYLLGKEIPLLFYAVYRLSVVRAALAPVASEQQFRLGMDSYVVLRALASSGMTVIPEDLLQMQYDPRWSRRTWTFEHASLGAGFGFYFAWQSLRALPWRDRPAGAVILGTRLAISIVYKITWGIFLHGWRGVWRKVVNVHRTFRTQRMADDVSRRHHD